MLPSVVPRLTTDLPVRVFPGAWKLLSLLRLPLEKVMVLYSSILPGKSHGWRNLVGCSPWGREESDMTERLPFPSLSLPRMELHSYLFCLSFYLLYFFLPPFEDNGLLSGCLMSSASIQKLFCGIYSAFKCSFDEFVGETT